MEGRCTRSEGIVGQRYDIESRDERTEKAGNTVIGGNEKKIAYTIVAVRGKNIAYTRRGTIRGGEKYCDEEMK